LVVVSVVVVVVVVVLVLVEVVVVVIVATAAVVLLFESGCRRRCLGLKGKNETAHWELLLLLLHRSHDVIRMVKSRSMT